MGYRYFVVDVRWTDSQRSLIQSPLKFYGKELKQILIETYKQFANMPAYRNVDNLRLRILVYRASKYPKFTGHDAFMVDGQVQTKFVFLDWMDNVDVLDAQEQELLEAS